MSLHLLAATGDAAARFFAWRNGPTAETEQGATQPYIDALVEHAGDALAIESSGIALSAPWRIGWGWWSDGPGWHRELWLSGEHQAACNGAGWFWALSSVPERLGIRPLMEPRVEIQRATDWPEGDLKIVVETPSTHDPSFGPGALSSPYPLPGQTKAELRTILQSVSAHARYPIVVVDPDWRGTAVRDSVMAQLVEWLLRAQQFPDAAVPSLTADALSWWKSWALPLSRAAQERDGVSLAELYEIALRSVQPDHPARHRTYWKKSLRARGDGPDFVKDAACAAGMSRSSAYELLRKGGRSAAEFRSRDDPVQELARWLVANRPERGLAKGQRDTLQALIDAGMTPNSARRAERRTRALPENERHRRLAAAMRRAQRKHFER